MPADPAVNSLPDGLLLGFYGDDFTGSTDVMEALALSGLRTVLFLSPPSPDQLALFDGLRAVGVAGISRSLPVEAMRSELEPIFEGLKRLKPPLVHYKICSTFDSSARIGSIGRAIEIGQSTFGSKFTPLLVGAPVLGRYQAFGNLFARSGGDSDVFRLDRHPTMRQHPVTPMMEGDLQVHLAQQTNLPIGLLDLRHLAVPPDQAKHTLEAIADDGAKIILLDVVEDRQLPLLGQLIWQGATSEKPVFAAGSSGIEYALTSYWREIGVLPEAKPRPVFGPVSPLLVVSGSCSPVTERQIAHAVSEGFEELALSAEGMLNGDNRETEKIAVRLLAEGKSVILHTSRGPDDPRLMLSSHGDRNSGNIIGRNLGVLLFHIFSNSPVKRIVVAGGDTSGYVARELSIEALEMIGPVAPGSPLCRATSSNPRIDGLEILFKGGQVGKDDLFSTIRQGTRQN